jgi:hypothetical protein
MRIPQLAAFALVVVAFVSSAAHAQALIKVAAVDGEASITDGIAQVTFKIAVTNDADSPMTNLFVVFADNTEINVGDVAPEATVTTEQQSRTIDVSGSATRSLVIDVTLKYAIDGENVELPWTLSVLAQ